ncbi:hypothetical protein MLD38_033500 [Melastoma candidum]|uniref:Uncharacterized protein n=1 Tax=Melastoma candidum TaxID=119954 RepID=A0ACB9MBC1_9MYRT|nr:hypothetical protein MLD38_033500 [Melastoma candidum]
MAIEIQIVGHPKDDSSVGKGGGGGGELFGEVNVDSIGNGNGDGVDRGHGDVPSKLERLSPAARLFHAPRFNCYIVAVMGCKTAIDPAVVKEGLKETLLKHPRFSSKLVGDIKKGGKMKWVETRVNLEDHVIVPQVDREMDSPERFVEDYISYLTGIPLDTSRPLWELHILNVRTSDAEAIGVFRIHHSVGDGASLISLLLACTRKTSDPQTLPTLPMQKRAGRGGSRGVWWFVMAFWSFVKLVWNSFVDFCTFVATFLFLKDTATLIKGNPGVEKTTKRFVHRTVSLDDIKMIKNELKMTINDVVLGLTQASLSRYLTRRYEMENAKEGNKRVHMPKHMRLRATILVNLRPTAGIQALSDMMAKGSKEKWGNLIGYILVPFNITLQNDPLEHVRQAKSMIDRKKQSLEALITYACAEFVLKAFGSKVASAMAHRLLFNTTVAFSNLVGPMEEISFYGHPMAYLAPSVYGHPHALTIHFQSYVNKMTISIAADPEVIPDLHQLCDDMEESLESIKAAIPDREMQSVV